MPLVSYWDHYYKYHYDNIEGCKNETPIINNIHGPHSVSLTMDWIVCIFQTSLLSSSQGSPQD